MSLNIKDSLEIVKRAGYGSGGKMTAGAAARRMADGERNMEAEPLLSEEELDLLRAAEADPLDEAFAQIELQRNPQNLSIEQLLDVNDL